MFKRRTSKILKQYPDGEIIKKSIPATYLGGEKRKFNLFRGTGLLILTKDNLYFEYIIPRKKIQIPIKAINKVELTKWFSKRTKGKPVIKISFINRKGKSVSKGWIVKESQKWLDLIRKRIVN
ncbi:MAG: hypothetical protein EU548_09900 [Promethearchaeota archaeon]|nr:MAG: hypothetical protein EU548_09900 [Candidatus Lokiarchaeota archaeon]